MTPDALKLASLGLERDKLKEEARHNVVQEQAALSTAKAKVGEAAAKTAGTMAALIGRNDQTWEVPDDEILRMPGAIAWDVIRSKARTIFEGKVDGYSLIVKDPIIVTYDFHFMAGQSTKGYDFDIAMSNLFTILVGTNQSTVNWTKADLAQYIFCTATLYAAVNIVERNVAVIEHPLAYLAASPKALVSAITESGIAHPDVVSEYQEKISELKSMIAYVKKFLATNLPLPKGLNVVNRWLWLTKWIFMDEVNSKPRLHVCNPKEIHIPASNDAHYITTTDPLDIASTSPISILGNILDKATRVMHLAAFKSVTAYLFKAAREKNTLDLLPFDADLDASGCYDPFTYDEEFLLQLVNMKICPDMKTGLLNQLGLKYSGDDVARIGQGAYTSTGDLNGFLIIETSQAQVDAVTADPYILGYDDRPLTKEEVFMATRFQYVAPSSAYSYVIYYYDPSDHELTDTTYTAADGSFLYQLKGFGTELFVSYSVWEKGSNANQNDLIRSYTIDRPLFTDTGIAVQGLSYILRFDHHAQVLVYNGDDDVINPFGDVDWVMPIAIDQFSNIQRNALMQLWGYTVSVSPAGTSHGSTDSRRSFKKNNKRRHGKGKRDDDNPGDASK